MKIELNNQIALVTGASRGIGAAIAQTLKQAGAFVIGTATSQAGADAITEKLGDNGGGMVLDVSDAESISNLIANLKSSKQLPTILVNNAGVSKDNLLMRLKDDEWDFIMDTNLKSVYRMSKACIRPMMKARTGRIITIGSVIGAMGNPGQSVYATAKAGLIGFSKSLAKEIGSRNITVNVIAPGFIQTDMTKDMADDNKQALMKDVPLGRLGEAQDIANAVLFLASDMGQYITGETLHVNGGMYMS
ncbi:MAG TPA: 3-oxoacyl-ACP reductase FabG [Oceanospirillales bacterium]|nr:3-oxoacyl-ACP reductase FabG [Oceanospirillales bacterium]